MTDTALPDEPLWYKDAILYEVHIRAFQDSTNDGIGDINGLIDRLDYLSDLGITAIWLLPFYPSPLKDGGYDIADYTGVHEHYGTRDDFAHLLQEAHRRGIRVITELVLNHTSSDHPWFQAARRAPEGSPEREFYVWSDTPARYADTRIIFKDYETSNWSWDPVAKAYYWHRFYMHQPDLNFDNPARTFDLVRGARPTLGPAARALADVMLAREADLDRALARITRHRIDVLRIRCHGDYHLGQVLWTGEDFMIIDFEGEPGRPLTQRRFKRNPLRDAAGMLRSLHYASAAEMHGGRIRPDDRARLGTWARAWSSWVSAAFLGGYLEPLRGSRLVPRSDAELTLMLEFFLIERCVYEIGYEINNRPDWLEIPIRGLLELLGDPP